MNCAWPEVYEHCKVDVGTWKAGAGSDRIGLKTRFDHFTTALIIRTTDDTTAVFLIQIKVLGSLQGS
jgi:hypothetical protein